MSTRPDFSQSSSDFSDLVDSNDSLIVSLKRFMNQYELAEADNKTIANIVSNDHQYKKRFHVPAAAVPQMMQHLSQCYSAGLTLHFLEIPPVGDKFEVGSGLSFDFEFITPEPMNAFEDVLGGFLITLFNDILTKALRMPKSGSEVHHSILLGLPNSEYVEDSRNYKRRFNIMIPGIQVCMRLKKFIYDQLYNSSTLRDLFQKKTGISFRTAFGYNARCLPNCLIGSCLIKDNTYLELMSIQKITIEEGSKFDGISIVSNPAGAFTNLIYECSINHQMAVSEGGVIRKRVYQPKSSVAALIAKSASNPAEQLARAYDEALIDISDMSVYDDVFGQFKAILDLLSDERAGSEQGRTDIIGALSSSGHGKYRCIALWFCRNRCTDMTLAEFNERWLTAINRTDVRNDLKSLRHWAGVDSPSQLRRFLKTQVQQMLLRDVKGIISNGSIGHSHIASYLKFMFKNTFVTTIIGKTTHWYEFVTPSTQNYQKGQLYKWKHVGPSPASLKDYICSDLEEISKSVLLELLQEINSAKDDNRRKYLKSLKSKFMNSMKHITNNSFKESVVADTASKFMDDQLIRRMDKTKHIMGVGNGVLEFDHANVRLLDHYHSYPISMYTETDYIPYDENHPDIKKVYGFLHSLVPETERDALDFILFFLSTSCDWYPKESLFLIITGNGCHAIDTPICMYDGSLKMVQDVKVHDQVMGDDNTPRTVQELFHGTDEMVQIAPIEGNLFVVNKDHILSLKIAGEVGVIDIKLAEFRKWSHGRQALARLYTADGSETGFQIKSIGQGQYYGFELDGNHRYLTGDHIVHHNSNGKSILIEFFRETIGEMYARRMPLSFITDQTRTKSSSADPAVMEMKHARFVNYSESDRNERANIARIKELTGGDTMSGRQLYGEQENFKPNCNHLLATNHHLRIESTEHAVWRRFVTYKFKITFKEKPDPESEFESVKNPKLVNELKDDKRYHAAFLAILIHYRSRLYSEYNGEILKVPHPTIKEETNVYRQQEDIYERFIVQRVFYKEGKIAQTMDEFLTIFRNYYRNENGERLKIKNDDLKYLFLNSSIQPYIKYNPSGVCVLDKVYTIDEGMPIVPGSLLFKEYIKLDKKIE